MMRYSIVTGLPRKLYSFTSQLHLVMLLIPVKTYHPYPPHYTLNRTIRGLPTASYVDSYGVNVVRRQFLGQHFFPVKFTRWGVTGCKSAETPLYLHDFKFFYKSNLYYRYLVAFLSPTASGKRKKAQYHPLIRTTALTEWKKNMLSLSYNWAPNWDWTNVEEMTK